MMSRFKLLGRIAADRFALPGRRRGNTALPEDAVKAVPQPGTGHERRSGQELFEAAFGDDSAASREMLLSNDLPPGPFRKLPLQNFNVVNKLGYGIKNCSVWFPERYSLHLKPLLTIQVTKDIEDCHLFFFRLPDKRSRIKITMKGRGHVGAFFSEDRIFPTIRFVDRNCRVAIGEDTFIGGGIMVLLNSTITVGAGGLWSDGVLLQATDSHGIVDLDRMEIINAGTTHITIGKRVWLGRDTKVMKNVAVGEGSIVAAGSIVTRDVPRICAVAGIPAKIVRERVSWTPWITRMSDKERAALVQLRDG